VKESLDSHGLKRIDFTVIAKHLGTAIVLCALCSLSPVRGLAANNETHPQISIKTKYVEIDLTVDTILKPFPELFTGCLSEGKAWFNRKKSDTAAEWRDNRKAFRGLQWYYARNYTLRSVVGPYVSVERSDEWFHGGAHPNQHSDTILWDNVARKRTNIRAFFLETADDGPTMTTLAQLAKLAVAAAKLAKDISGYDGNDDTPAEKMTPEQELQHDTFIQDGIKPKILELGPVTLAPSTEIGKSSGLTFHYSPYGVGPYVEGSYTVFVPWTKFQQYLSPQGAALFGGERPDDDKERW
jgi:uncharacterized protein DUF3298